MFFSACLLQNCVKDKDVKNKHMYSNSNSTLFKGLTIVFALLVLMIELLLLFYSVGIAIRCTKPGTERFVHIVLVIMFPFPYALVSVIANPCAKEYLNSFN
jgi:hypothetical protein